MTNCIAPTTSPPHVPAEHRRDRRRSTPALSNAFLFAALWGIYSAVRRIPGSTPKEAVDNAARLLAFEQWLGIDIESAVQSFVEWPHAFVAANAYYLAHFPVTLVVLCVAFWRDRTTVFPVVRNALIGCTTVALGIHLVIPMAPPRMLPGFVDAGREFGPDPYSMVGSDAANQFAAMPSMHVAWAFFAGFAIWHLSRHRLVRFVAVAHPAVTAIVVIMTGHHFVMDAVIGSALAVIALIVAINSRSATTDTNVRATPNDAGSTTARFGLARAGGERHWVNGRRRLARSRSSAMTASTWRDERWPPSARAVFPVCCCSTVPVRLIGTPSARSAPRD